MSTRDTPDTTADTNSQEAHLADDDPVNTVRLAEGSVRTLIVDECVLCGEEHRHGANDYGIARGEPSHRVAHCDEYVGTGYWITFGEDADPPDRYFRWVLGHDHDLEDRAECGRPDDRGGDGE